MSSKVIARTATSVVILFLIVCTLLVGVLYRVEASFTSPLTVSFTFPLPTPPDPVQIGGSGEQQVFRLGSVASAGNFAGFDPKAGTTPTGTTLNFFTGNSSTIGANDFVYAIKIKNSSDSTLPLTTFQVGSCTGSRFTSIGYLKVDAGTAISPTTSVYLVGLGQLFFTFEAPAIPKGGESAILFYTSPDPPSLVTSSILGGDGADTDTSDIASGQKMFGACPVSLVTDKKIGCTAATVADSPLTAVTGAPIAYQITVRNNGKTPLSNIVINDVNLGGNIGSSFTVGSSAFTGTLAAGQTATASIPTTANASVTNTVNVTGEYLIPTPPNLQGGTTGQTISLTEIPAAILSDSTTLTVLPKPSIQAAMTVAPTTFTTLPQTLTYTLKATNSGTGNLATVLDVDAKLKGLLTAPPAGLSVAGTTSFPTASQTVAAGAMATTQFSITVNSVAGWQALADAGLTQATFTMSATGTIPGAPANTCGVISDTKTASAITMFTPPCTINLEKLIACDAGTGVPADAEFSANAIIYRNAKIYYRYKVTNTSLLDTITNITITDTSVSASPINVGNLVAGAMRVIDLPATIANPVGTINSTATVNGTCKQSNITADATSSLKIVDPKISAQKLVNGTTTVINYQPGTPLTFTLSATNDATSGTPLNLTIDDPLLKSIPGVEIKKGSTVVTLPYTEANVAPGNTVTITATATFPTLADFLVLSNGQSTLKNIMTVTAAIPGGAKACTLGASPAPLTLTSEITINVIIPPKPTDLCIVSDCEPNCPAPPASVLALARGNTSDDKPGSLLLYNIYTSSPNLTRDQDTALTLTNLGPKTAFAHLFLIDGATCSVSDFFACLSPAQTGWWLASELDPGVTGYAIAVAVDEEGSPISFNQFIGASRVKFASGHTSTLNAQSFSALYANNTVLPGFVPGSTTAELKLDGVQYNQAPVTLAIDNIASPRDNNSTLLILNPVGGDLNSTAKVNTIGTLSGQVFNQSEKGFSFQTAVNNCQVRQVINDSFLRIPFQFSKVIASGTTGTVRFSEVQGGALMGSVINLNPDVKTNASAFSHGHNLHILNLSNKAKYIIPIFRPHS